MSTTAAFATLETKRARNATTGRILSAEVACEIKVGEFAMDEGAGNERCREDCLLVRANARLLY